MFCKLVEHVPGRPLRNAQCRVCDHNSANPKGKFVMLYLFGPFPHFHRSVCKVFQVAYVIIKAANAPRPGNWILERSVDGTEFKPWQYYAISDTECLTRYNVTPRLGPPTYKRDDEVICTSYYSRLVPLEHGEIHTSLINGRPSADDPSQTLLEFTSARYIRLRLQRIRTLNADLMTLSHHDPKDLDPIVTRRYYYSIKDISVGGMCICYGHARSCPLDETTKKLQCQCEHNTCGESCNECCPGYHQNQWRPGTISAGNKCEKCNCHNKAEDCYYNQDVADQNRSINIHGQFIGGGVCINCTQHTTGINCEICADGYYRPYKVSPYEDNPCHPCDCDPFGSLSSDCIKDDDHSDLQHGTQPGQCQCKEGYTGEKCDRCAFGYKGYPSCVHCNCSLVGSINDDPCTEPCLCKENVDGENCDRCKPGFYNLQERNPQGCTECFCFGVSDVCDSLAWPISQVSDMAGWLVTDLYTEKRLEPQQGQFAGPHQISVNNTAAVKILKSTYYWSAPEPYLGNKLTAFGGYLKYTVSYDIPVESVDSDMVSNVDVIIQGNEQILSTRSEGLSLQPYEEYSNAVKLVSENLIDFNTKKAIDRDRLMTVLANVTHLLIRANYNVAKRAIYRLDSVTLDTANANAIDLSSATEVEQCECPQGYTGISCEVNDVSENINDGAESSCISFPKFAVVRPVSLVTTVWVEYSLEVFVNPVNAMAMQLNVIFMVFAFFSPTCHMDNRGEVICDKCLPGYGGSRCERCANGYYGNPLVPGESCVPCDCNGNIDPTEDGHCDAFTGECLKCVRNTQGHHCEKCADGYYGDAVIAKSCHACDCGHTQNNCKEDSGQCICPPHTQGPKCELCEDNYWGLDPKHGCMACDCSDVGSASLQCDLQTGQCQCKDEFGGEDCSKCALGYRDYPDCVSCDCDLSGTKADKCDESQGVCSCEEETGICACKENVFGFHCSECKTGTFALRASNPLGCTPCFCFGLSEFCSELEDHVRIPVTLTPDQSILHVVSQSNLTGTVEGVFSQFSDVLLDATTVREHLKTEPFYWRLPDQFQGDQLMAYGGKLKYIVAFYALDGFGTSNFEPQILIKGGRTSKLVIYVDISAPQNGVRSEEEVEMKEHVWKYFNSVSDQSVTRSDFMSVLSNVEYILIKASYGQGLQQSRIANISMEIAVKAEETHLGRETAHLIEQCECPTGYAGLSCQNCRDNTAGEHCSVCAPGYYGKVIGSVNDCSLCACPRTNLTSFSPTCVLKDGHDFYCDACLTGYEGQYCERCSLGYYGNPEMPGSSCQQCQCNPSGSIHNNCDHISGQCLCKQGVTGQLCDACEPRHILVENECVSCNDDCTGVLLNDLDHLDKAIFSVNFTGVTFAPYGILADVENVTKYLKLTRILERGWQLNNATQRTMNESRHLTVFIDTMYTTIKVLAEVATSLNETLALDFQLSNSTSQSLQEDISTMLKAMRRRHFMQQDQKVTTVLNTAERLLLRVQKEYLKPQQELAELKKAASHLLTNHNIRLQEAQDLVNEACTNTNETNRLLFLIYSNLAELNDKKLNIQENKDLSIMLIKEGKVLMDVAAALATDVKNFTSNLEIYRDGLDLWNAKLRHHVDDLVMQMSTRGALDLVYRAEDHAAEFQKLAEALDSGLSNVRNVSLNATNAVHAHSSITNLIEKTENLADDASRVITNPLDSPEESLDSLGKEALQLSSKFLNETKNLKRKNEDTSDTFFEAKELAVSANTSAVAGLIHIVDFNQKLLNTSSELSKVNDTLRKTNELIMDSSKAATSAERQVKEVEAQANLLFDRLKPLKMLEENLSRNLSEIKELISQARKQAASIKVAISADRDCIRAYSPQISSANYNILTLNVKTTEPDNLLFYLGSSGNKSPAVKVTHFKGCIGEASLNGKSIGLWNYIKREGACNGCFGSPQDEDTSFHFDGSGYSVVERALRSTVTQIIMFFSTFSPNGLLLYLASNGTRDFLSLELVDGKVRLTVDLGSGPLMLKTENRYNNGTWYKISFSRNKKQGVLAVMDAYNLNYKETKQGESPGVASDLNRSDKDPIYIGGLPRSRAVSVLFLPWKLIFSFRKGLNSRTYVGCIKNLEISRSTFDLLKNSYGVRKGCILEPIRSVSILNDGYIELLPKSLSPESELMVTFATKNSSGIILAGLSKGMEKRRRRQAHLPFFSIMLIDGHLAVHINAGDRASTRKIILQPANGTYSDGQEHSVILIRNKRIITVQVDESNPAELRLGLSAEMSPMNISNFYAGGVPAGEGISGFKMTESFYGCIRNLIFNMQLLDFTTAVRYEHVDMDSCLLSEKPKSAIQAEDIEIQPELQPLPIPLWPLTEIKRVHTTNLVHAAPVGKGQCAQDSIPDHVPSAHQFGLAKGSHIVLPFNQSTVRRKLSVQLNLRTYASSGLIYYLAHQNQIDYAALQLHGGQLYFLFDLGKGKAVAFHPAAISDGKWHTVKTEYVKRKGIITVDGQESAAVNALGDGNTLDVEGKLYLGGLPLDYTARNTGNVTHSIPACIGSVMINNKQLDKESPVSILAVNKCYAIAQEGTFFDGSGFAALVKEGYKVRSDVNITFEFRTMAMNGVLLGISSAKVDAIGLEIVNGKIAPHVLTVCVIIGIRLFVQVLFHVNNGAGRITATYEPRGANSLCDGKWHKLQANKSKHRIALMIDGNLVQADNPHIQSTSADTNNPIYVGGFPAGMKQNCLTSKSSFHGCLRNLKLIKGQVVESYDFSKAFDLHGVFPHSCPGSEH
ncbi:Laminin subunit alpha-1 [Chelonia mydas]|uniref:Laminin subunit alpha-2 n=1 Tax=Chelonia mydas TaxID=8469 RepID=M7B644_CHEMY|nr:Laminin subunit alpha-1 [Chelonia mydas]